MSGRSPVGYKHWRGGSWANDCLRVNNASRTERDAKLGGTGRDCVGVYSDSAQITAFFARGMNKQGTEMSVVLRRYVEFLGASGVVLILGGVEITRKPVCDGEGGLGL